MNISERAKILFDEAQQVNSDTRAEFVAGACEGDPKLLEELNTLLAASAQSESYFEQLAGKFSLPALADDAPVMPANPMVGQWRLLEPIGRGGMGSVYLAERADEQYEQRVAIKMLPMGLISEESRGRFALERQILANLVHDNIARLLDGGMTADGTPYFVMDYVDGEPINSYCDRHGLGIDERLDLFLDVCEAVQYAHRNLVVHRDLKPGNVLVDNSGAVKLLDFGIAKLAAADDESARLTRTGYSPMTSLYASPEMLMQQPATTLTDVYALGVMLYELLTTRNPFDVEGENAMPDVWQRIRELEPALPSRAVETAANSDAPVEERYGLRPEQLRKRLQGDLDTITLRAIAKRPEDRYSSVEQLSADIKRHQQGLPVLARPATIGYRFRKFAARRKSVVAAVVASILFVATTLYQARQTSLEADRANREAAVAQQVSDYLVSIFEVSNPSAALGETISARELLDRGAEGLTAEQIADPVVRARLMSTIGHVYEGLALHDDSESLFDQALTLQVQELGELDAATLETRMRLGSLYLEQGRFADAENTLATALGGQRQSLGLDHPDTLASMHGLAIAHAQQGDFATAAEISEELVPARRELLGENHPDTLKSSGNLGIFYKLQGQWDRAEEIYRDVLEAQRRVLPDDHPDIMSLLQNLADLLSDQGRYSDAEPVYEQAIAMATRLFGAEHPQTTRATINFANLYQGSGDWKKAEELYARTVEIQRKTLGSSHPETLNGIAKLGELYGRLERYSDAERMLLEARAGYEEALGPGHTKTLDVLTRLSKVYYDQGKNDLLRAATIDRIDGRRALAVRDGATSQDKLTYAWILVSCEPTDLRDADTALPFAITANEETGFGEFRYLHALALAYEQTGMVSDAIRTMQAAIDMLPADSESVRVEYVEELDRIKRQSPRP